MYLRNAKQALRAGGFDERRYGFGGLMDLLRACQRDGLIRLERDRRGGLRVFQGAALARGTAPRVEPIEVATAVPSEPDADAAPAEAVMVTDVNVLTDADVLDVVEVPPADVVDTTAELLGRATSKRRPRVPSARKPATAPKRRMKKSG
jgi:hypothetical protein